MLNFTFQRIIANLFALPLRKTDRCVTSIAGKTQIDLVEDHDEPFEIGREICQLTLVHTKTS